MKLKLFKQTDIQEFLGLISNIDEKFLLQFAGPRYSFPLDETQLKDSLNDPTYILFKAINEDDKMVGHCQLMRIDLINKTASIGRVFVANKKQGLGYGTKMLKLLLDYAKNELDLERLSLRVFDFNVWAIKCYIKLGFIEVNAETFEAIKFNEKWECITMNYNL
ncbi:MAG: GNAT family N-acetyltransferase [Spirochaetaceae bacterium]